MIIELHQHFRNGNTHFKDVKTFPTLLPVKSSPGPSLNWKCFDVVDFVARKRTEEVRSEIRLGEANHWPSLEPQNLTMLVLNMKI